MKTKHILTLTAAVAAVLLMNGCRSAKKEIKPKEYTSVPLYMAGQEIPGADQEKYLYNGSVKMYSVGRLVDPRTGTMREAGTVYRIESAPRWNLIPQYDANPESFARKSLKDQYADSMEGQINQTLAAAKEIKAELSRTRTEMLLLEEKCSNLQKVNAELSMLIKKEQDDNKISIQNMRLMQKYIQKLERRIEDMRMQNFGGGR